MFMVDERDNSNVQMGDINMDSMKIRGNCEVIITYPYAVESFDATGMTEKEVEACIKKYNEKHVCFLVDVV